MTDLDVDEWLRVGVANGWCGAPVCSTHDGVPTSADEDESFDSGGDVCVHVLRLYADDSDRVEVEANHGPSQWRKTNRWGLVGE